MGLRLGFEVVGKVLRQLEFVGPRQLGIVEFLQQFPQAFREFGVLVLVLPDPLGCDLSQFRGLADCRRLEVALALTLGVEIVPEVRISDVAKLHRDAQPGRIKVLFEHVPDLAAVGLLVERLL